LLTVFFAIKISYFFAETYFFDKIFYYKSIDHGYWVPGKELLLDSFGERSLDLIQLDENFQIIQDGNQSFKLDDDETYTIALIGDSYIWGQGLRFEDTVSQILEKQLNEHRKTEVLSLGYSGDSILDYLMRYEKTKQTYSVDLYLFMLVGNDLLLTDGNRNQYNDHQIMQFCQKSFPELKPVYDLSNDENKTKSIGQSTDMKENWLERFDQSWNSVLNLCVLDQSLSQLPQKNAIYVVSSYEHSDPSQPQWEIYKNYLKKHEKTTIYLTDAKKMEEYAPFWKSPDKYYPVSDQDSHPSKLIHNMTAKLIFQEISLDPYWKFNQGD